MLVGDLRTEAVHMIIVAGDAHDLRTVDLGANNLGGLEIGRNKDTGLESAAGRLCRHRVGQVSGGRAAYGFKSKVARLRQRNRNHAVFEAQRREADRIVFEVEGFAAKLLANAGSSYQGRETNRIR